MEPELIGALAFRNWPVLHKTLLCLDWNECNSEERGAKVWWTSQSSPRVSWLINITREQVTRFVVIGGISIIQAKAGKLANFCVLNFEHFRRQLFLVLQFPPASRSRLLSAVIDTDCGMTETRLQAVKSYFHSSASLWTSETDCSFCQLRPSGHVYTFPPGSVWNC